MPTLRVLKLAILFAVITQCSVWSSSHNTSAADPVVREMSPAQLLEEENDIAAGRFQIEILANEAAVGGNLVPALSRLREAGCEVRFKGDVTATDSGRCVVRVVVTDDSVIESAAQSAEPEVRAVSEKGQEGWTRRTFRGLLRRSIGRESKFPLSIWFFRAKDTYTTYKANETPEEAAKHHDFTLNALVKPAIWWFLGTAAFGFSDVPTFFNAISNFIHLDFGSSVAEFSTWLQSFGGVPLKLLENGRSHVAGVALVGWIYWWIRNRIPLDTIRTRDGFPAFLAYATLQELTLSALLTTVFTAGTGTFGKATLVNMALLGASSVSSAAGMEWFRQSLGRVQGRIQTTITEIEAKAGGKETPDTLRLRALNQEMTAFHNSEAARFWNWRFNPTANWARSAFFNHISPFIAFGPSFVVGAYYLARCKLVLQKKWVDQPAAELDEIRARALPGN